MGENIKVVWICHFSNNMVRENIRFKRFSLLGVFLKLVKRDFHNRDFAVWVTNGIKCFEKYSDIELTVVFPHQGVENGIQSFSKNGIRYICYHSEDDNFLSFLKQHILKIVRHKYDKNRKVVKRIIEEVKPDLVHIVGAENPYYSITALDVPNKIPLIVSLQTLLNVKGFKDNYKINKKFYDYRALLEKQIIQKSDYIATGVPQYVEEIRNTIKPDVLALKMKLAVGVDVNCSDVKKEYDFVYFAANINKACDLAIEAFALAKKTSPFITMNVSGQCSPAYKKEMESRLKRYGILDSVYFTGPKDTHKEVIGQIKKSRFALLPFKVDQMPSTIREAMACGLPVVTFSTPSTELLNSDRESILLAELGDIKTLANNMTRLIENEKYSSLLSNNSIKTIKEKYGNEGLMESWHSTYLEIVKNSATRTLVSKKYIY